MKKALLLTLLIIITVSGITAWKIPSIAHNKIQNQLNTIGLTQPLPTPEKRLTGLRYKDIAFDTDEKNTIETLIVTYSFPNILRGKIDTILADGLALSAEIDAQNKISFPALSQDITAITLPADRINLKNATISIISASLGSFQVSGDAQAYKSTPNITLTATLNTDNSHIGINAKLSGEINTDGILNADITIENAKLARRNYKLSRVNGNAKITVKDGALEGYNLALNAGGFSVLRTPWQNATITLDANTTTLKAQSVGIDSIDLSLNRNNNQSNWNGRISAPRANTLQDYMRLQNRFPDIIENANILEENEQPITIDINTTNKTITYNALSGEDTAQGTLRQLLSGLFVEVN